MIEYLKRTWKNKVAALLLLFVGIVPILLEKDATVFVFLIGMIVPLFFTGKDYVTQEVRNDKQKTR